MNEIKLMLKLKKKAEIQALSSYGFQYLTQEFLPTSYGRLIGFEFYATRQDDRAVARSHEEPNMESERTCGKSPADPRP